jgi:hypothetical protein
MLCSSCLIDNEEGLERCASCGAVLLPPLPDGASRVAEEPAPEASDPETPLADGVAAPEEAGPGGPPSAAEVTGADRRSHPRLEIPISLVLRQAAAAGRGAREERTVAENISRGGVRVMTTWVGLADGELIEVTEIGGDFQTRAAVRGSWVGADRIPRLNLEFVDRKAPSRLVGTGDVSGVQGRPVTPPQPKASPRPEPGLPPAEAERSGSVSTAALRAKGGWTGATAEEVAERQSLRDEVLSTFQVLKTISHYELLGVPRDADVSAIRAAYSRRARHFHPDRATRDMGGLRDAFQAILVRLGEARDALEDPGHRRFYDARLPPRAAAAKPAVTRPSAPPPPGPEPKRVPAPPPEVAADAPGGDPAAAAAPLLNAEADALQAERAIVHARKLYEAGKYWDAIQELEQAMPRTESHKLKLGMRVLWARAMSKNAKWRRRAEEALLDIIKNEPRHVEAHFELGMIYTAGGLTTRAQRMYRRVLELDPAHKGAASGLNSLLTTRKL